jgi:hypothetical protein
MGLEVFDDGAITITGNGTTTINGMASVMITPPPSVKKLKIKLRGGDDTLTVTGVMVDILDIKDKIGSNTTTVQNGDVRKNLKITHGPGDDTVNITTAKRKNESIKTDGGRDNVNLLAGEVSRSTIRTGDGGDQVDVQNVNARVLNVNVGRGDDWITMTGSFGGRAVLNGGRGFDCIDASGNKFVRPVRMVGYEPEACVF